MMCGMLYVVYGNMTFSSVLANVESDMDLYEVPILLFLFVFRRVMMLISFHICGMLCV